MSLSASKRNFQILKWVNFKCFGDIDMAKVTIDYDKCDGADCAECADVCPMEVLVLEGDKIVITDPSECSYCEVCMDVCPNECVKIEDED